MRILRLLGIVAALASAAGAQTVSLKEGAVRDWSSQRDTLTKLASAMPAEKFGYRATPAQRTWAEQILHVAEANMNQMGRLGSKTPTPKVDMTLTTPPDVLRVLADSFDFGATVLAEQTDETLLQPGTNTRFDQGTGSSTRVRIVYFVMGHTWDIYGQMVVYLRLNGVTPPASQRF